MRILLNFCGKKKLFYGYCAYFVQKRITSYLDIVAQGVFRLGYRVGGAGGWFSILWCSGGKTGDSHKLKFWVGRSNGSG